MLRPCGIKNSYVLSQPTLLHPATVGLGGTKYLSSLPAGGVAVPPPGPIEHSGMENIRQVFCLWLEATASYK